jgi:hypothetical protein
MKNTFKALFLSLSLLLITGCDCDSGLPIGSQVLLYGGVEATIISAPVINRGEWAYWVRYKTEYGKFEEECMLVTEMSLPVEKLKK